MNEICFKCFTNEEAVSYNPNEITYFENKVYHVVGVGEDTGKLYDIYFVKNKNNNIKKYSIVEVEEYVNDRWI